MVLTPYFYGLGSSRFARRYSENRFSFFSSSYIRCFNSLGISSHTLCFHVWMTQHYLCRVPPFGYLRIEAYLQLPVAFRSLSRPSSAPDAKAFTLCSSSLELSYFDFSNYTWFSLFLNCLSFIKQIIDSVINSFL